MANENVIILSIVALVALVAIVGIVILLFGQTAPVQSGCGRPTGVFDSYSSDNVSSGSDVVSGEVVGVKAGVVRR